MLTREGCRDWRWDSAGWVYLYTYTFTSTWVVGLLTSEELRFVYVERGGKSKFTDPRDEITSLRASQTVYSLKWHPRWSTRRKDDESVPLEKLSKGNEKEVEESSATTNVDSDSSWEEREKRMPTAEWRGWSWIERICGMELSWTIIKNKIRRGEACWWRNIFLLSFLSSSLSVQQFPKILRLRLLARHWALSAPYRLVRSKQYKHWSDDIFVWPNKRIGKGVGTGCDIKSALVG